MLVDNYDSTATDLYHSPWYTGRIYYISIPHPYVTTANVSTVATGSVTGNWPLVYEAPAAAEPELSLIGLEPGPSTLHRDPLPACFVARPRSIPSPAPQRVIRSRLPTRLVDRKRNAS